MNAIRLQELLAERYNTQYTGLLRNIITRRSQAGSVCSYCNSLSSRPVGHTMQRTLKLKLQNVLNITSHAESGDNSPAIFVGGRRHNRKKRKYKNGRRKNKKGGADSLLVQTPTPPEFEDVIAVGRKERPLVSCLDIEEPVFNYKPALPPQIARALREDDADSMYNSSDSLTSWKSKCDKDQSVVCSNSQLSEPDAKVCGVPRSHSEDSGVFCDDLDDDVGYDDTFEDDLDTSTSEQITDDGIESDAPSSHSADELADFREDAAELAAETSTSDFDQTEEQFDDYEDIDSEDEELLLAECNRLLSGEISVRDEINDTEAAGEISDSPAVEKDVDEEPQSCDFLEIVPDEAEEILFDLTQLEVNTTQEDFDMSPLKKNNNINHISKINFTNPFEDFIVPTDLEDEELIRVPMDLLIDDDEEDEVLYEARHRNRKDLSVTCNPLYEHALKEEEDSFSLKSYQSGFKTNFDNINLVQITVPTSDKAAHKSLKESAPLIKRHPAGKDRDDELACCVIL